VGALRGATKEQRKGARSTAVFVLDEPRTSRLALPLGELLFGFDPGHAVALLDLADELAATARDDVEVIVGEPAPLLLGLARGLLPVTLNEVPVQMDPFGEAATRSRARSLARDASRGRGKDWGLHGLRSVRRRTERGVPGASAGTSMCKAAVCTTRQTTGKGKPTLGPLESVFVWSVRRGRSRRSHARFLKGLQ